MTWLYFTLPLMVAGIAAALLPVLVGSVRHGKYQERPFRSVEHELDFWHDMLGHRSAGDFAPPSELIESGELLRVMS